MEDKIKNTSLKSCSQILEETWGIQDPVQFTGRKQNRRGQWTALESVIHEDITETIFYLKSLISTKDNQLKTSFFFSKMSFA